MPQTPSPFDPPRSSNASAGTRLGALGIILGLTLLACWSLILSGNRSGRGASDDLNYHWVAIHQFAQEWPTPDLSDYASATTPGYHLLLAPMVRAGLGHSGAQLVASVWTLALIGVLGWVVSRAWGWASALLMLPMIASMYVLFPGVWLLPDNAGWFFVLGVLLLALRPRFGWVSWMIAGLLLVALVWVRQVHIWAAGVVWLSAWLGNQTQTPHDLADFFGNLTQRLGRTIIAQGMTIPAFVALLWFLGTWNGLVPPSFQDNHQGPNPATPGFILMQLGILSIFFVALLWPRLRMLWAHHWRWVLLVGVVGLGLGLLPISGYSYDAGRYGGWWNGIRLLPTLGQRSPVFVLGSLFGALALACWLSLAPVRDRWIWVGTLVAFTLAQSANHTSWQRYHEPMLLMMILLIFARSEGVDRVRVRVVLGSLALSLMLAGVTVGSLWTAKPIVPERSGEPQAAQTAPE